MGDDWTLCPFCGSDDVDQVSASTTECQECFATARPSTWNTRALGEPAAELDEARVRGASWHECKRIERELEEARYVGD